MYETIPFGQYAEKREEAKERLAQLLSGSLGLALMVVEELGGELSTLDDGQSLYMHVESPAIILPASSFIMTSTNLPIMRRSANWLSLYFEKQKFDGTSVLEGEVPDYVRTNVRALSLGLSNDLQATTVPITLAGNRHAEVLDDNKRGIYYGRSPLVMTIPESGGMDESRDWDAFTAYPVEALEQAMFEHQFRRIERFERYLEIFERAIGNEELNPRR